MGCPVFCILIFNYYDKKITPNNRMASSAILVIYYKLYNGSRDTSSEVKIGPPGGGMQLCVIVCVRV